MYNLNTKRAIVEEGGVMEWVSDPSVPIPPTFIP